MSVANTLHANPRFTIYIPAFNRAHLLPIALQSLAELDNRDFEVLIVDDGSSDNTREVVDEWAAKGLYPLRYVYQDNQGMHASHNTAIREARGFFTMRLDSDDSIQPDALDKIAAHWEAIPDADKPSFAGVSGLCLNDDGTISGEPYPENVIDSDYLEIHRHCKMNGERREALRTEVWREFPFPRIEGEKRLRSTLVLLRLSHHYKVRFVNDVLQVNRHAVGGISANRFKYRMLYPKGQRLYFLEAINLNDEYTTPMRLLGQHMRFVRYSLHAGVGLGQQVREVKHKAYWLAGLPMGLFKYGKDRLRMKRRGLS